MPAGAADAEAYRARLAGLPIDFYEVSAGVKLFTT